MPADALVRLNEVTNELMELARASRANKVRSHALVTGLGPTMVQEHVCGYLALTASTVSDRATCAQSVARLFLRESGLAASCVTDWCVYEIRLVAE